MGVEEHPEHSIECLYNYALSRLGLTDSPSLRIMFLDAHDSLEWSSTSDTYIIPQFGGGCPKCDNVLNVDGNQPPM